MFPITVVGERARGVASPHGEAFELYPVSLTGGRLTHLYECVEPVVVLGICLSKVQLNRRRHPLVQHQSHLLPEALFFLSTVPVHTTKTHT